MGKMCFVCRKVDYLNQDLSFHRFPSHPLQRVQWFERLGLPMNDSTHITLCSAHFLDSDIIKEPNGRRHLRKSALPLKEASSDGHMSDSSHDGSSSSTSTASEQPDEVQISESPKLDSPTSLLTREVVLPDLNLMDTACFFCRKEQCKEDQIVSQHNYGKNQVLLVCSKHFENMKHDVGAVQMGLQAVSGPTRNCNSDAIKINTNTNSQVLQNIRNDHEYTTESQNVLNTARSVDITSNSVPYNMPMPIKPKICSDVPQVNVAKPLRKYVFARFVSELKPEDFQTPTDAKRSLHLVFHTIKKKNTTIKTMQQQNRRLREQVESLKELVEELKRENETLTNLISKKKVKTQG